MMIKYKKYGYVLAILLTVMIVNVSSSTDTTANIKDNSGGNDNHWDKLPVPSATE